MFPTSQMKQHSSSICLYLTAAILLLTGVSLCSGTVQIPVRGVFSALIGGTSGRDSWDFIIRESRFPATVTAALTGASLATSGLLLQTAFRNPLAGPDILGINGGAGLGVALVMMLFGGNISAGAMTFSGSLSIIIGALAGALAVMAVILFLSSRLKNHVMLLIAGLMVSYLTSSVISLLNFFSSAEGVHSYVMWGMGNFGGVSVSQLPFFSIASLIGITVALMLTKPLNALLLGEMYAENLGINVKRTRTLLLLATGVLVAITTAFCGPVSFIGLAVPHIARLILKDGNHRALMPVTILTGAAIALICNIISSIPGDRGLIPLNAITPVIGAPIILYVLLKDRSTFRQ